MKKLQSVMVNGIIVNSFFAAKNLLFEQPLNVRQKS